MQVQPVQGKYYLGQIGEAQPLQSQPYPGHTYQVPVQPQPGMVHPVYPGGIAITTAEAIPGCLGYPPLGVGLNPQGYQILPQDPNRQLPFIVTLDLLNSSRLTNDPIYYYPYWPTIPTKLPNDIPKFEGKLGEDPSNHVMTYHLWCASNSLIDDSIHLHLFQ